MRVAIKYTKWAARGPPNLHDHDTTRVYRVRVRMVKVRPTITTRTLPIQG